MVSETSPCLHGATRRVGLKIQSIMFLYSPYKKFRQRSFTLHVAQFKNTAHFRPICNNSNLPKSAFHSLFLPGQE